MPGTVDDFMNRFGGGGTIDDSEAQQYHDRFVSNNPEDSHFDSQTYHQSATEYLGKLPDDQFHQAARNAYDQAPPDQRTGLLGGLLAGLAGSAGSTGIAGLASKLGLGSTNPSQMNADDATRLMNYARQQNPEVLNQTVQNQPWLLKAMGNPIVMGALAMAATKLFNRQRPNT
ncbi:MAG: hypothetical protein JO076_09525 [Verrucomicrobia bacterium]|nr:hypothetical protein [Verrucomicrobiota bacterium]